MSFLSNVLTWADNVIHHDKHAEVTVKSGDTLWGIAKATTGHGEDYKVIVALNPGIDPDNIRPGQVIKIPLDWVV